jgi:hypothetical protein
MPVSTAWSGAQCHHHFRLCSSEAVTSRTLCCFTRPPLPPPCTINCSRSDPPSPGTQYSDPALQQSMSPLRCFFPGSAWSSSEATRPESGALAYSRSSQPLLGPARRHSGPSPLFSTKKFITVVFGGCVGQVYVPALCLSTLRDSQTKPKDKITKEFLCAEMSGDCLAYIARA